MKVVNRCFLLLAEERYIVVKSAKTRNGFVKNVDRKRLTVSKTKNSIYFMETFTLGFACGLAFELVFVILINNYGGKNQ
jgi:hypothetical protein